PVSRLVAARDGRAEGHEHRAEQEEDPQHHAVGAIHAAAGRAGNAHLPERRSGRGRVTQSHRSIAFRAEAARARTKPFSDGSTAFSRRDWMVFGSGADRADAARASTATRRTPGFGSLASASRRALRVSGVDWKDASASAAFLRTPGLRSRFSVAARARTTSGEAAAAPAPECPETSSIARDFSPAVSELRESRYARSVETSG